MPTVSSACVADHQQRDHQIAVPRDIDQRGFGNRRGRRDHLGGEQEGRARRCRRRIAAPTRPITASPGMPSASAIAAWAAMIQKPTWRTCRATASLSPSASFWVITGREDRIEAGLQLLRQRGDLLRDIIDADPVRRDEQAEDGDVEPARAPFDRVGGGERHVAPRHRHQRRRMGPPAARHAVAAEQPPERGGEPGDDRDDIGDDQAVARRNR